ncbi:cytokinin dehydrogenase 2-like [Primulina huaijiensis]|uniref:cytokinin dehydrogenase 2-like n=1 Tax=Primulina huaijiensis TaxID=1492673 RepID=UPI003CC71A32
MSKHCPNRPSHFIFFLVIIITFDMIICISAKPIINPLQTSLCKDQIPPLDIRSKIRADPDSISKASNDYGNIVHKIPSSVFYPSSVEDIIKLIEYSKNCSTPFSMAARGQGHSARGQAMAYKGVFVDMASLKWVSSVVFALCRGKGDFVTCSEKDNSELFYAVLGGLGQFGIITRARIVLAKTPTRAKWARLLYSNFSLYTKDQEKLISSKVPNYVKGFLITNESIPDSWRSSFNSSSNQDRITFQVVRSLGFLISMLVFLSISFPRLTLNS